MFYCSWPPGGGQIRFLWKLSMNKRANRRTDCATVVMKKADKGEHSAQSGQLELGEKCGKTIRFLRDHDSGWRGWVGWWVSTPGDRGRGDGS